MMEPGPGETLDSMLDGRVRFLQHRKGYRFTVDAVLLAHRALGDGRGRALDMGAGCGILSVLLAWARPDLMVVAAEIQAPLADLIRRNVALNGLEGRVTVREGDGRDSALLADHVPFDLMVANPPYFQAGCGRTSPSAERALARRDDTCSFGDLAALARRSLRPQGVLHVVLPPRRLGDWLACLPQAGLEASHLLLAQPRPEGAPQLAFIRAVRGGPKGQLQVEPPLVLHNQEGGYSSPVEAVLRGEGW